MATALVARWRYTGLDVDWDKTCADVRRIMLEQFATVHSLALQQTLWEMGRAVLEAHPEIAEISLQAPNKHHFVVRPVAVRAGEPERGLLRRRPPVRPDRGDGDALLTLAPGAL